MNWLDNVSSDSDQPIAAACLMQGHWPHRLHPFADPVLCRVVIDVAEPRVVAAQAIEHGTAEDLGSSELEDLTQALLALEVHRHPSTWGFTPCPMLPTWAHPTFSERQIEELERIEGYLVEASEESFDSVLAVREAFLRGIGLTDRDMYRAARQSQPAATSRKGGRMLVN